MVPIPNIFPNLRTNIVTGSGAVGSLFGGPGGAALAGMCTGVVCDVVETATSQEPRGVVAAACNVRTGLAREDPSLAARGVGQAATMLASDAACGLAGGVIAMGILADGLTISLAAEAGKSIMSDAIPNPVLFAGPALANLSERAHTFAAEAAEYDFRRSRLAFHVESVGAAKSGNASSQSGTEGNSTGSQNANAGNASSQSKSEKKSNDSNKASSGSQPPKDNRNNKMPNPHEVSSNFSKPELARLEKYLNRLGYLREPVLRLTDYLFKKMWDGCASFFNFMSFANLVEAFFREALRKRYDDVIDQGSLAAYINETGYDSIQKELCRIYEETRRIIRREKIERSRCQNIGETPEFLTEASAMYHYRKHRMLPTGDSMGIKEYFSYIDYLFERVRSLPEYASFLANNGTLVYELCVKFETAIDMFLENMEHILRRVRIVLKFNDGNVRLASWFVQEQECPDDELGDEFVNGKKRGPDPKRE